MSTERLFFIKKLDLAKPGWYQLVMSRHVPLTVQQFKTAFYDASLDEFVELTETDRGNLMVYVVLSDDGPRVYRFFDDLTSRGLCSLLAPWWKRTPP